eukprot:g41369.t1
MALGFFNRVLVMWQCVDRSSLPLEDRQWTLRHETLPVWSEVAAWVGAVSGCGGMANNAQRRSMSFVALPGEEVQWWVVIWEAMVLIAQKLQLCSESCDCLATCMGMLVVAMEVQAQQPQGLLEKSSNLHSTDPAVGWE